MIVGILLAAGKATRFGGDKLLAELGNGQCVAEVACARLRPVVDRLIAVVRPEASELAIRLTTAGAEICVFANADKGMGASLAHGVRQAPDADGWLIALADMPLIATADARQVVDALRAGAAIAAPVWLGERGHPVGFAQVHFAELTALSGDQGARTLLTRYAGDLVEVHVSPAGTWHDVDTAGDLVLARMLFSQS